MTPGEFESLLPDYLAGELDADRVAAVEAFLAAAPQEAALVRELRGLHDQVRATAPALRGEPSATCRPETDARVVLRRGPRLLFATLRYAAAAALAFGVGWWARGGTTPALPSEPPTGSRNVLGRAAVAGAETLALPTADAPLNSRLAQNFRRAVDAHPQSNSLTWAILSIAR